MYYIYRHATAAERLQISGGRVYVTCTADPKVSLAYGQRGYIVSFAAP